jgi:hypothetical protein
MTVEEKGRYRRWQLGTIFLAAYSGGYGLFASPGSDARRGLGLLLREMMAASGVAPGGVPNPLPPPRGRSDLTDRRGFGV